MTAPYHPRLGMVTLARGEISKAMLLVFRKYQLTDAEQSEAISLVFGEAARDVSRRLVQKERTE